ncbi:MAG: RagB/SusD family nutrient uptake outer membrane protein [Sphingobacteriales bacterium]|nr:MAG: RagB/SusD family nutrient uptake outer membrane protein [Sphingobacteriales bacterium]
MKFFKIFVLVGTVSIIAYACGKKFLDKAPIGATDPSALANKNGVRGLLIGAYALLDGFGSNAGGYWASAGSNWVYGSVAGTESHKGSSAGDQPDAVPIENFTPQATNGYFQAKWAVVYDAISRCNDVIRTAALANDISATELSQILGQARALRAWYHMDAKKVWNKIPFVDETITYGANNYFLANTDDAWPKIEQDLTFAIANLPTHFGDPGRINKYAAEAILAKAYMFEGKYSSALPLLNDIINSDNYQLVANYHDNFNILTKNSSESILAAQSSVNDGSGGNNGNWGDVLNFPYGGSPGTCCGFNQPTQWFVDHFKTNAVTGLPDLDNFDATNVTNDMGKLSSQPFTPYAGTLDPRLDWTVGRRGIPYLDWGVNPGNDWVRAQTDGGPYSPIKNVYPNALESKYTDASFWSSGSTAMNTNLIRYADVLLWAAECETEVGSLSRATSLVNQVRTRAANPAGFVHTYINNANPQGGFTNIPAANYKIGNYSTFPDQATARKAVRYERLLELGMEGHRFFDLVRWGIAATEINRYLSKEKVTIPISYLATATFTANKNEYFPIPQTEIDKSNKKMVQNPGY